MTKSNNHYRLEEHVNDWVKSQFDKLKLKNQNNYYTESARCFKRASKNRE